MSSLGYFALGLGLLAVYLVAMAAVLFGAAGTLAVPMFWAYLVLFAVLCVGASAVPAYLADALRGATSNEVDSHFTSCNQELDLSVVLTLIAAAEARIRLDARRRTQTSAGTNVLTGRLRLLFSRVDNDWAVPLYEVGIMEAWKDYTATLTGISAQDQDRIRTCIGRLKKVLRVRHWVAHLSYPLIFRRRQFCNLRHVS